MTITIDVNPQAQDWLKTEANRSGVEIPKYVQRLIEGAAAEHRTGVTAAEDPTLALFARWDIEDATNDTEEITRRQQDGDELLEALAQSPFALRQVILPGEESE